MKLYHLYNENFEIAYAQFFEEGQEPENAIYIDNYNFVKGKVNPETLEVYESATDEDMAEFRKSLVPLEVPLWSMRILLKKMQLFDSIIYAINQMDDPLKSMALDYLEYGNYIERNSNTVILIQQILQMSDAQVDNLFIDASNLKL
jgi:hypothetical protein